MKSCQQLYLTMSINLQNPTHIEIWYPNSASLEWNQNTVCALKHPNFNIVDISIHPLDKECALFADIWTSWIFYIELYNA